LLVIPWSGVRCVFFGNLLGHLDCPVADSCYQKVEFDILEEVGCAVDVWDGKLVSIRVSVAPAGAHAHSIPHSARLTGYQHSGCIASIIRLHVLVNYGKSLDGTCKSMLQASLKMPIALGIVKIIKENHPRTHATNS
jgi:hypothetical protein